MSITFFIFRKIRFNLQQALRVAVLALALAAASVPLGLYHRRATTSGQLQ